MKNILHLQHLLLAQPAPPALEIKIFCKALVFLEKATSLTPVWIWFPFHENVHLKNVQRLPTKGLEMTS